MHRGDIIYYKYRIKQIERITNDYLNELKNFENNENSSKDYYEASQLTMNKVQINNLINFDKRPESVKVSIIVPVCNVEEFLSECLDSCINQTLQDIEIICVNDGSSDNSLNILMEYANKDGRVKIIDKDNAGYGHAINIGVDMASGEYIGIVESDDFVELDMYEKLYNIAILNELDFIKADFYRFIRDEEGNIEKNLVRVAARASDVYNKVIDPKYDTRAFHLVMQTWSGIYNRNYLISNNIRHNETPGASYQDNGFWFQTLMYADRIFFYDEAFYMNRRDNPNSSVYNKGKVYCMHEEYEYIKAILDKNPDLYNLYKYQYSRKKFLNFLFTYNRIGDEFKWDYLFSIQEDLQKAINNFEIDWNDFDEKDKLDLQLILENPEEFYYKNLRESVLQDYDNEVKELKNKLKKANNENLIYKNDIGRLEYQLKLVSNEKDQYTKYMYDLLNSKSHFNFSNNKNKHIDEKINKYSNKNVHIVFITDENYAMPTAVAITSLKINKKEYTNYTIHILVNEVSNESESKFLMLNDENFRINLIHVNLDKVSASLTKKDGDLHVSPAALFKLRLPTILKDVGKVLYLDGDILIQDDLLELYNINIKGRYAAVVKDIISERNPNHMKLMDIKHKYYFNSGMMLLNLTKCRRDDMTNKLLEYRKKGKNHFMDQDTLNAVFKENVKYVSYKYNYLNKFHDWWGGERLSIFYGELVPEDKIESFKNAVIIHLGSHEKPWKYHMGYLSKLYKEYYDKSPYKDTKLKLEDLSSSEYDSLRVAYTNVKEEKRFYETKYNDLKNLINEDEYYENEYKNLLDTLGSDDYYAKLEKSQRDVDNLKNSTSFKVGRAVTYIPRKLRSFSRK